MPLSKLKSLEKKPSQAFKGLKKTNNIILKNLTSTADTAKRMIKKAQQAWFRSFHAHIAL
jgi:hypothetical protein